MCYAKSSRGKYVKPVNNGVLIVQMNIKYLQVQTQSQVMMILTVRNV